MRFFRLNMSLHNWLSLFVGVQLFVWLATGLYFNLMDADKATGNIYRDWSQSAGNPADFTFAPLSAIATDDPVEVTVIWIQQHPYYYVVYEQGMHSYQARRAQLFDAVTGTPFTLDAATVHSIARASYTGEGRLGEAVLAQPPFEDDIRQQNPMWKVAADDALNTTIYLDAVTADILKHVNDDVRLKDFMLKLHFMDYGNTGGFNHWLIMTAAFSTLLLSITGCIWLLKRYQNDELRLTRVKSNHNNRVNK